MSPPVSSPTSASSLTASPARHLHVGVAAVAAVTVVLGNCSLGLALRAPPVGAGPAFPYLDALGEPTLPSW